MRWAAMTNKMRLTTSSSNELATEEKEDSATPTILPDLEKFETDFWSVCVCFEVGSGRLRGNDIEKHFCIGNEYELCKVVENTISTQKQEICILYETNHFKNCIIYLNTQYSSHHYFQI